MKQYSQEACGAERPGNAEGQSNAQPRRNMKYLTISAEKGEGPQNTLSQELNSPFLVPGPGRTQGIAVNFITAYSLQLKIKIQLDPILHLLPLKAM